MNTKTYSILAATSLFLYAILGFAKEVVEKGLLAWLHIDPPGGYHPNDFLLNISPYLGILLVVAGVFIVLAIYEFVKENKKAKLEKILKQIDHSRSSYEVEKEK